MEYKDIPEALKPFVDISHDEREILYFSVADIDDNNKCIDVLNSPHVMEFINKFTSIEIDCLDTKIINKLSNNVEILSIYLDNSIDLSALPPIKKLAINTSYKVKGQTLDFLPESVKILIAPGDINFDNLPNIEKIHIKYKKNTEIQSGIDSLPDSTKLISLENIEYINFYINKFPKSLTDLYIFNYNLHLSKDDIQNIFISKLKNLSIDDIPNFVIITIHGEDHDTYEYIYNVKHNLLKLN